MKPMILLLALAALVSMAGLVPFPHGEIADLTPVDLVCLTREDGQVLVTAAGGLAARGGDPAAALAQLHAAAPGRLLLETVDHAVFTGLTPDPAQLLESGLRPAVGVYTAPEQPEDPAALAKYLRIRTGGVTLGMLSDAPETPVPALKKGENGLFLPE